MGTGKAKFQALSARGIINKAHLKQNQYTISLMNEGLRTGRLHPREVHGIQTQLMRILKDLIRRYTREESSSVAVETAEGLLTSIFYSVDAQMQSYAEPEKAIAALQAADIRDIYDKGVERVRQCFEDTKRLYSEVKRNKLNVDVDAYQMTIDESLPVFIKKYEIVFDAHNTMASIDYPLAMDDMRVQGVFYIKQYLERLLMETRFCYFFSHEELLDLLRSFGQICRFDYRIELFNIFELMFNNAVFSVMSGGSARQVTISAYQFEQLNRMLAHWDASRMHAAIQEATEGLQHELNIHDAGMIHYMQQCSHHLVQRLNNAASHNSLQAVIVTRQEERIAPADISFSLEDRMSDVDMRKLLDEVSKCEQREAKALLIKSRLHSLHDYLDLLESDTLYGEEYQELFALFGHMELAILAKIVFYEELRSGWTGISSILSDKIEDGDEETWQKHYIAFMRGISAERLKSIERFIDRINYEEMKLY
ncbi:DUF6179 domain-containing protein [Paenibacillus sp. J2TS4]|uniref:DUF6179 domain-containing protein n=1 Tax=Paenibacillus sp. J2TS4 TaxID=2807194 RepID=UPI001B139084|nr:DUF6179 domain-containing protein [Paenibacillus sp. J2TS4]GIP35362.1 hypothetical protein J2TS4_45720 [Paenibacillus sp. J2TS4]